MIHIMILQDGKEKKGLNSLFSKLKSRGYDLTFHENPDVDSNNFKEYLNDLEPQDYIICIGSTVNKGLKVLQNKLRSIEAAFFLINDNIDFEGKIKAKKVFIYGNEHAKSVGIALDVEPFIDEDLEVLIEELLIDIISLEH